jgi:dienelactone hydrolase
MTLKSVLYRIPGMDEVKVRRDIEYGDGARTLDLYEPPDSARGERRPAVLFVTGYPDPGFEARLGCKIKEMESYISWARLTAASGMTAVTYSNREPAADVDAVLRYLRQNAEALDIDESRIGVFSFSGNVPNALSLLMRETGLKCAVLCYGILLDLDGATGIADSARQWGFANPNAGKSVEDLPRDLPLFVARAGRDETPGLNEALDRFVAKALERDLPFTLVNHAGAPHGFDLMQDSEETREVIRQILAFLRFHLGGR